jgi:hypothetical protein
MADKPVTREEKYLAYLTGDYTGEIPKPITRKEKYLYELCLRGMGGEISPEEIKNAVNEYLEKNPVKPGATTEQAQQIEQNKTDVASLKEETSSLKEDLDNLSSSKISKFYATNNGENHLADSDNGKIADMMVYGKSEQKKYGGYQLIPLGLKNANGTILSLPYTRDGITINITDDGKGFSVKGTNTTSDYADFYITKANEISLGAGTYTRSGKGFTKDIKMVSGGGAGAGGCLQYRLDSADFSTTETVEAGLSGNHILRISANTTVNTTVYYQLEKGSKAHDYEPYTGGAPSPSPDYPQEIKSVVNPTVKVCGVNLFDQTKVFKNIDIGIRSIVGINCYNIVGNGQSTDRRYYLIECKPNTKYYITFVNSNNNIFIGVADKNYIGIKDVTVFENITSKTFTTGNNAKFIVLNADGTSNICISEDNAAFEPYHEQTIQLPYTLNAIPVASGGNVTIDGQQYVADYVDVERGKLVRMVGVTDQDTFTTSKWSTGSIVIYSQLSNVGTGNAIVNISSEFKADWPAGDEIHHFTQPTGQTLVIVLPKTITTIEQGEEIRAKGFKFYYILVTPIEIDLTTEEITAFKALVTYYPTTNISVNSEQLDGYTVFNYPISMQNGWNYVKQQLNDNRDYIYDMDLQSAEAYVNSEYAVALTELEV